MKLFFTSILLCISYNFCTARPDTLVQFLNSKYKPAKDSNCVYVRMLINQGNTLLTNNYYFENHILYETYYQIKNPKIAKRKKKSNEMYLKHGYSKSYNYKGVLQSEGNYFYNGKQGLWLNYDSSGRLTDSIFYLNDSTYIYGYKLFKNHLIPICHFNSYGAGYLWELNDDSSFSYFGKYNTGYVKDSIWTYNYSNGKPASQRFYQNGTLTKVNCINEMGEIVGSNCFEVMPQLTVSPTKYLSENIIWPKTFPPDSVKDHKPHVIVVLFAIDENGNVCDLNIIKHSFPAFNQEALRLIKAMPQWIPGRQYNKPVKVHYLLPITFKVY